MKLRADNADTKVTFLVPAATAKYIRIAAEAQGKYQSRFVTDVLERYSKVEKLDTEKLRDVLFAVAEGGIGTGRTKRHVAEAVEDILSIFGIEKAGD